MKVRLSSNSFFFLILFCLGFCPYQTHSHFQSLNFNHSLSNTSTKMKTPDCCFPLDLCSLYSLYFLSIVSWLPWLLSPIKRVLFLGGRGGWVGVNFHWLFLSERVIVSAALTCSKAEVCHSLFLYHPNLSFNAQHSLWHVYFFNKYKFSETAYNHINDATP